MAKTDIGKAWEDQFKKTWEQQFPGTFLFRLKDLLNGYKETSKNPCDFLCMPNDKLFMVECKAHKGASIPFEDIPQYDRLLKYKGLKNVYPGCLVWLYEKDVVFWVSIETMEKLYTDGEKSIGIRHFGTYDILFLPGEKKRVFITPDYSKLIEYVR